MGSKVLNFSWSGSAAISGALLDHHGYAHTFRVAAVPFAVALAVFSPLLFVQKQSLAVEDEGFTARQVVVVVDPFSTGGNLAAELLSQGYAVIALWTKESNVRYHDTQTAVRNTGAHHFEFSSVLHEHQNSV